MSFAVRRWLKNFVKKLGLQRQAAKQLIPRVLIGGRSCGPRRPSPLRWAHRFGKPDDGLNRPRIGALF